MLELAILGFLYAETLHGYDLRTKIAALTGHVRPIADGTLYPAIKKLEKDGYLTRELRPGKAAAKQVLTLTASGRAKLLDHLRNPPQIDLTDENRWFVILAFLRYLNNPQEEIAVLERRLEFITQPASYFYDGERPLRSADFDDPYRQAMLKIAHAASKTELTWLTHTLKSLKAQS